jgi:phage/plasmid-like protein (TIGR03299 family)
MSHEVESLFSAREIPWHGLGVITDDVLTAADAIKTAGLDWAVRKKQLFTADDAPVPPIRVQAKNGKWVDVPAGEFIKAEKVFDKFAVQRLSDGAHLGCGLGPDYETFQNVEAFDLFDAVVDDGSAKYETAGALFDGKVVFILARLDRDITVAGDKMVPYLLLLTSHDGSTALRMLTTPVRVVCANTMRMALGKHETSWSVRHTQNMKGRVQEVRNALQLSWKYYDEFEAEVERLMNQPVADKQVEDILGKVFPKKSADVLPEKALAVRGLYETAGTIGKFKGTGWGLLNAVNEWELWASPTRDEDKRLERQAREIVSGIAMPLTKKTHGLLVAAR